MKRITLGILGILCSTCFFACSDSVDRAVNAYPLFIKFGINHLGWDSTVPQLERHYTLPAKESSEGLLLQYKEQQTDVDIEHFIYDIKAPAKGVKSASLSFLPNGELFFVGIKFDNDPLRDFDNYTSEITSIIGQPVDRYSGTNSLGHQVESVYWKNKEVFNELRYSTIEVTEDFKVNSLILFSYILKSPLDGKFLPNQ